MANHLDSKPRRQRHRPNLIEALETRGYFSVDLSATVSIASPASHQVKPGQSAGVSIEVFNNGDTTATGRLATALSLSSSADGSSPIPVATMHKNIHVAAGAHVTFKVNTKLSVGFSPGTYFAVATVDPGNTFGESNLANNTATSGNTLTVPNPFPNLLGTWSGPVVVKKGLGKGTVTNQVDTFTSESQTTGAFTLTGTNFLPDGSTLSLAGQGVITTKGVFSDSGFDVPVDTFGEFTGKGKLVGNKLVITPYANALNSGTITLTRIG